MTVAGAAVVFGASWTTVFVFEKRTRNKFLASKQTAELQDEAVAELVADLSAEISRVVDQGVAPLLKLVS